MYQVTKRDGSTVPFQLSKIIAAMTKAFEAQGQQAHPEVVELLALRVTADFQPKIRNDLIAVEDIQDSVEVVLIQGATPRPPSSTTRSWWTTICASTTGG